MTSSPHENHTERPPLFLKERRDGQVSSAYSCYGTAVRLTESMKSVSSPVVLVPANLIVWDPAVAVKLFVVKLTKLPDVGVNDPIKVLSK